MPRLPRRNGFQVAGWLCSAILHAATILVLLIALVPAGLHFVQPLQLLIAPVSDPRTELFVLEISQTSAQHAENERRFPPTAAASIGSLIVPHPGSVVAAAQTVPRPSPARVDTTGGRKASFFGTQASGDRFLYILDTSGSMQEDARMGSAIRELLRSIARLREDQSFGVLLFASRTRFMFHERVPTMLPATAENKIRIRRWVRTVRPRGDTNPREALARALRLAPSAIFMLSDGKFDPPSPHSGFFGAPELAIPELIDEYNHAQTPVHTISFVEQASKKNMAEIAALTGGEFRFVSKRELRRRDRPTSERPRVEIGGAGETDDAYLARKPGGDGGRTTN